MLTRRTLLITSAISGLLLALGQPAWAQAGSDATTFVNKLGADLIAIVNGPGDYETKKRRLTPLIETAVDIQGIGQFCLGRFWRTATPDQQQQYSRLFHDVLVNNIGGKIGEFQGVTFAPTTTMQQGTDAIVGTVIKRPNQQPNNVQWVVANVGGQMKITDVVAEGVRLAVTQRSDYAAFLSRNGNNVDALIAAMKQQIAR